jgi:prolyl oligopeptidase
MARFILGASALLVLARPAAGEAAAHHRLVYPATPCDSVVEDFWGTKVADPYRWLEVDSPRTRAWVDAQRALSSDDLADAPRRFIIESRLKALWNYSRTEVPWREAGRIWFVENSGLQHQSSLYVQTEPGDSAKLVLDPNVLSPDGSIAIGDFAVSPDRRWLAYSMSRGGADAGETHVRDLSSGRDRDDVVAGSWGTACWTFDGGGFFYMRPPAPRPGEAPDAARVEKQLFYHALGTPQAKDRLLNEWKDNDRWLYVMMSDDGRRAIVVVEGGSGSRMYVMDLGNARAPNLAAPLVALLAGRNAMYTPMGTVGDTLYVRADLGAPHGRVLALDLALGARATPRVVIPEIQDVIQGATVAGDLLAVHYLVDVKSELRLFTLQGAPAGAVELPGIGSIGWALNGRNASPELWYSYTSFIAPETAYRVDLRTMAKSAFRAPRIPFDASECRTDQFFYGSKDGTRIPMFITTKYGSRMDGTSPVFLTAYGGYGTIVGPRYQPDIPLWLERGGFYVVANIRGGGEYGSEWHRMGSREHKQNSFDDFVAAAQYLIDHHYAAPGKIAIYGHSNGGLLIGAAITQRPDLFGAAVANAGHYDMLRFHKFTVGAGWIPEYGSPDSEADFRTLRAYSPLHNVRAGTCYPPTLLLAADHDDRVVPSHAYKFAAALQAAQACDRPILLRVAKDASHSYESGPEAIAERRDMWAFIMAELGVDPGIVIR